MNEKHTTYTWSIYTPEAERNDTWEKDFNAPVPDGIYDASYRYFDPRLGEKGKYVETYNTGIIVQRGKFNEISVWDTLDKLTANEFVEHPYIESLDWNGKYFEIHLGS